MIRAFTVVDTLLTILLVSGVDAGRLRFIRQPSNITVVAGTKEIILNCYVENFQGKIGWNKDGFVWNDRNPHERYSIAESKHPGEQDLRINNVSVEDDGLFNCQARTSTEKLRSRDVYVTVLVPPKSIIITPSLHRVITIKDKEHKTVRCQATGSKPNASIRWRIGGVAVPATENKVTIIPDSKLVTTSSTYSIHPDRSQNGTLIECVVTHLAYGGYSRRSRQTREEATSAVVNVIYPPGPPTLTGLDDGDSIVAGSTIVLKCTSYGGNPLATITWTLNNVVFYREYTHHANSSTSELHYVIKADDHKKTITCSSNNPATFEDLTTSIKLEVLYPPSGVQVTQHPVGAIENSSLTLTCRTAVSNPRADITWFRNGNPISKSRSFPKPAILKKSTFTQSTLTLNNVKREDVVIPYVCVVTIPQIHYVKEVATTLKIYYPPLAVAVEIYYLSQPLTSLTSAHLLLEEGKTVQMRCVATGGNPRPTLKWYKDGILISEDDDKVHFQSGTTDDRTFSTFEVTLASDDNGRRYECTAANVASDIPQRHSQTLQVLFAPASLSIEQSPLAPVSGQPMSLICRSSSSNPAATITWLRNGNPISSKHPAVVTMAPSSFGGHISTSRVTMIPNRRDDGAVVTCSAKNGILKKSVNKDISLNVEFSPYFESESFQFNATEGENSFVVFVPAIANPSNMTYRWWRLLPVISGHPLEKVFLETDERFSTSTYEGILRIQNIRKTDAGLYIMEATNPRGSAGVNVTIDVLYPPIIVDINGPPVASVGENITLSCEVESHPLTRLEVAWVKEPQSSRQRIFDVVTSNGRSLLHIRETTSADRGTYTCIASNGVGKDAKRSFSLKILFGAVIDRQETASKVAIPQASSLPALVSLACTASGNPGITFQWKMENGSAIHTNSNEDDSFIIDHVSHDNNVYTSHLYVKVDHSTGTESSYICETTNVFGKDAVTIKLLPPGRPDPPDRVKVTGSTFNSISLSWRPGFDGGALQTFFLQYKLLLGNADKSGSKNNQWVEINVPQRSLSYTLDGFASSATYLVRMRSRNSFGYSDFSPPVEVTTADCNPMHDATYQVCLLYLLDHSPVTDVDDESSTSSLHDVNVTIADGVFLAKEAGGSTFNFIPVAVVFSAVILVLLVVLAVFFIRRRSATESYRPKSVTTETISLPTPASSLTGSDGNSSNTKEDDLSSKAYLPSCSNRVQTNALDLGTNRVDRSGQSLDRDLSREPYATDGRSELSNCSMSVGQHRSGKFSPSSHDTSFSSLAQDDVNRGATAGCGGNPQGIWTNKSYEDIELHSVYPRRVNSVSAADRLHVAEVTYNHPNPEPQSCGHQQSWESSCKQCNEERRQYNAILRRGSETMKPPQDRITDVHRGYHTTAYYASHPSNDPNNEALCHMFQPRGARFCGIKTHPNVAEKDYSPSVGSGSSLGYRSGQDHCSEEVLSGASLQDEERLHDQFFVPSSRDATVMYSGNLQNLSPQQIPPNSGGCSPGRLYVLGINEGNRSTDPECHVPIALEEDARLKASFLQGCGRMDNQETLDSQDKAHCSSERNARISLDLNPANIQVPTLSSQSNYHRRPQCIVAGQQHLLANKQNLYDDATTEESLKRYPPPGSTEEYAGSPMSSSSSTHHFVSAAVSDKNLRIVDGREQESYSKERNFNNRNDSDINRSRHSIAGSYSIAPRFLGVDEEGTLFV